MNVGFWRRFAALLYDALLIIAVLLLYTALALFATGGRAIVAQNVGGWVYLYYTGEIALIAGYYALSCHLTGHTLGMRAWRLRVQRPDGTRLSLAQALLRLVWAVTAWLPFALGVLWLYVDRERLALQDRFSGSRVVRLI
ncbi:MAG: RDD family protein [Proteobacteria bacterium]|nr:RDD family protein [Pseudomonadota bacterium]